jgi:hypothetical protein
VKGTRDRQEFIPLPSDETIVVAWPTPNHSLFAAPEKYFAQTRVNPDYGKPGWTRDCGKRFHRGCDIAPIHVTATGRTARVIFTDCATNRNFESEEPTLLPHDEVFCTLDGVVREVVTDEDASDYGKHIVVKHTWPRSGRNFYTLYGHLAGIFVGHGSPVASRQLLARMGQTSRNPDARDWMAIAPHLHFEVRDAEGESYDPVEFLERFLPRS